MKLIIDIAKEKYNRIVNSYQGSNVRPKDYEIAIINGIPLDKISSEIEKVFCMSVVTNELRTPMEVKTEILQIIDKYRGSEGADADRE
jgi:hypothetical protein